MIYTHVAAALLGFAVAAVGTWQVQGWRYNARIAQVQQAHAESSQKAEQSARAREQSLIQARQKAEESYAQEKRNAVAAAVRARSQLDGLRNELYAISTPAPGGSDAPAACRIDAGTLEKQLLDQCATALVGVAEQADRLAAQVLGLQAYVRNVCVAP